MIRTLIPFLRLMHFTPERSAIQAVGLLACMLIASASAHAAVSWKRVGTVTAVVNGQMCYSDGENVVCDATAPTLSGGNVAVSGNIRIPLNTKLEGYNWQNSTAYPLITYGGNPGLVVGTTAIDVGVSASAFTTSTINGITLNNANNNGISFQTSSTTRLFIGQIGTIGIGTTVPGAQLQINAGAATTKGAIVKAAASQTANLFEAQNSSGTALAVIDSTGAVTATSFTGSGSGLSSIPVSGLSATGSASSTTFLRGDGTWATPTSTSQWSNGAAGAIYYNSGNVGIGTTTPVTPLTVYGTATFQSTGNGNTIALIPPVSSGYGFAINSPSVAGGVGFNSLSIGVAGSCTGGYATCIGFSVTNTGNTHSVAVGNQIIVNGANATYVGDYTGNVSGGFNGGAGSILLGYSANASSNEFGISPLVNSMTLWTDAGGYRGQNRNGGMSNSYASYTNYQNYDSQLTIDVYRGAGGNNNVKQSAIQLTSGATGPTIGMLGNVGIGTTSPGAQLQINAGAAATKGAIVKAAASQTANLFEAQNSSGTALAVIDSTGAVTATSFTGSGSGLSSIPVSGLSATGSASSTTFLRGDGTWATPISTSQWSDGASGAIYYNSGNVGIGTSTPGYPLEIIQSSFYGLFLSSNGGATGYKLGRNSSTGYLDITAVQGVPSVQGINVNGGANFAGNVGIGTNAPVTTLDVAGPMKVAGTGSEACTMANIGMMRWNAAGKFMEICQYP